MSQTPTFIPGPTWLTGFGVPPGNVGAEGNFYIDQLDTNTFYGPKTRGSWGALQRTVVPNATTGLIGGGLMAKASNTSISITAGMGKIVDYTTNFVNPTVAPVTITAQTITLTAGQLASPVTWWIVDKSGNVTTQTTRPQHAQRRQVVQLGAVTCSGNVITTVTPAPTYIPQGTLQLYDLLYELGPFVAPPTNGNMLVPNANLTVAKTAGTSFNPSAGYVNGPNEVHYISNPAENPLMVQYATRTAGSESAPTTTFDVNHWDNNGVITAISGGTSSIQRVFLVPTGSAGTQCVIQYGQTIYASPAAAIAALGSDGLVVNPDLDGTAALVYWLAVSASCTSLQTTSQATFMRANRFVFP